MYTTIVSNVSFLFVFVLFCFPDSLIIKKMAADSKAKGMKPESTHGLLG